MRRTLAILVAIACASGAPVCASESVAFTYDALGRLTQQATSGGVDNGLTIALTTDPADNRTNKTISGSSGGGVPDVPVIVLPINGFTIIPILIPQ